MSKEDVKALEENEPVAEEDNLLMFKDKLSGLDAFAAYIFVQNRLVRANYVFFEEHSNKNDFIEDYLSIDTALESKYGKPLSIEAVWRNDLYRDDQDQWGFAVSLGHLTYSARWSTKDTNIFHILYGENHDISHGVEYTSKDLRSLEEEAREKDNQEKL